MDELTPAGFLSGQGSRKTSQSQPKLPLVSPDRAARAAALDPGRFCTSGWLSSSRGRDRGENGVLTSGSGGWRHTVPFAPRCKRSRLRGEKAIRSKELLLTRRNPAPEGMAGAAQRFMASPPQPGSIRQPLVPRDRGDFKQLLPTINAWGRAR